MAIALTHAMVLLAIVGLLLWQVAGFMCTSQGVAQMVAAPLVEVTTPVDGRAVAVQHMPIGARIPEGQSIYRIECPQLEADIETAQRKLEYLKRRKLLLERRGSASHGSFRTPGWELRECIAEIAATKSNLDHLLRKQRKLDVVSPVDGRIANSPISGSNAVETNDTLAYIWPDNGDLLVEVRAPLEVIHRLRRAGQVEAKFSTVGGKVSVTARPIAGSQVRIFTPEHGAGKKSELWGILQCRPDSVPESVACPGFIGWL